DFVLEPANLRFLELFASEGLGLLGANAADALDRLAALIQPARFKLLLGRGGSGHGGVDIIENAPVLGLAVGWTHLAIAHVAQNFLDNVADQFFADLHGVNLSLAPIPQSSVIGRLTASQRRARRRQSSHRRPRTPLACG